MQIYTSMAAQMGLDGSDAVDGDISGRGRNGTMAFTRDGKIGLVLGPLKCRVKIGETRCMWPEVYVYGRAGVMARSMDNKAKICVKS